MTAQLSVASTQTVTVPFAVSGTGTSDVTDRSITASPIIIAPGATTGTATITIIQDALVEANETVILIMVDMPTNALLGAPKVSTRRRSRMTTQGQSMLLPWQMRVLISP